MRAEPAASKTPLGWLAAVLLLAGALVFLPALRSPLFLDDFFQTAMVEGTYPSPRGPLDLYNLVSDADRSLLVERGLLPWWTHPRLSVRFLRPLSSALRYADHRVLGNRPLPSHLHSFAWASLDDERRWHPTWLLGGSALSFAPVLSAMPWPRMLAAPALGIAATVALTVDHAWYAWEGRDLLARALAIGPVPERRGLPVPR